MTASAICKSTSIFVFLCLLTRTTHAQPEPYPISLPYTFPSSLPSSEVRHIQDSFLQDPFITNAYAHVQKVVSQRVLNIPVATTGPNGGADVIYNGNRGENGYRGTSRNSNTADYNADVSRCPNYNDWGVTYDDGPSVSDGPDTGDIMRKLSDIGAKATFFIIGVNALGNQDMLKQLSDAGHEVAIHTWTHHALTTLSNIQIVGQVKYTEALIYRATGRIPTFFRPPYGDMDDRVRGIVSALGYTIVVWNYDSRDASVGTSPESANGVFDNIKNRIENNSDGFISLQHDWNTFLAGIAVRVLDFIVQKRRDGGGIPVKPVAVGECIGKRWYREGLDVSTTTTVTTTTTTTTTTMTATTASVTVTSTVTSSPSGTVLPMQITNGALRVGGNGLIWAGVTLSMAFLAVQW